MGGGQCTAGEQQHRWAAGGQSTSHWYHLWAGGTLGSLTGHTGTLERRHASISFTLPCRPTAQCLNQKFFTLWQEKMFSLGSQQSSGAVSQHCSQDVGKFVL